MPTIGRATHDDIDEVLAFWRHATTVESSTDDAGGIGALLEHDAGALLIATDDKGRIVGTVIAGWDGWRGTMYRLAVAAEHRRRGIATALVRAAETGLASKGARRLHLIVVDDEEPAQAFWAAAGYTATTQTRFVKTLAPVDSANGGR
jgi:ribosomal protein S18 acetylase RimI-like enzyme